jgi:PEP-CTERM motif
MKLVRSIVLAGVLAISSVTAFADSITNLTVGSLPTSLNYGNSFASAATGTTFFDAYYFTIPNGSANSVTSSINLDSILGLSNLRARLYAGNVNDTTNSVTSILENWGTTVNFSPTVGITTVVLNPISLLAGSYTLQIKGTVAGLSGGSYAGVLNIANPVPEAQSYAMLLAGLGFMGFVSRRRKAV